MKSHRFRCARALSNLIVVLLVPQSVSAADGDLDPSFGGTGIVTVGAGALTSIYGRDVAVQSDGRIVVAGYIAGGGNTDFGLVRVLPDGTADASFGNAGRVRLPFDQVPEGADFATELLLRAGGSMWVAGFSHDGTTFDCAIVRLLANGEPDDSFSGDGHHIVAADCALLRALLELPNGQLLVGVTTQTGTGAVCRLDGTTGAIDATYGNLGCRGLAGSERTLPAPRDLLRLVDGSVLVAGTIFHDAPKAPPASNVNAGLARLSAGGNLIGTFGTGGFAECHWETASGLASSSEITNAVELGVDGSAYIVGAFESDTTEEFYAGACRFHTETGAWLSYGPTFAPYFSLGDSGSALAYDAVTALDGKLVVVGGKDGSWDLTPVETGTARLATDGTLDPSFHGDGKHHENLSPEGEEAQGVALQHDGSIVVAGWGEGFPPTPDSGNAKITLMRIDAGLPFRDNFETGGTIYWSGSTPP